MVVFINIFLFVNFNEVLSINQNLTINTKLPILTISAGGGMVDTLALGASAFGCEGSSPSSRTNNFPGWEIFNVAVMVKR